MNSSEFTTDKPDMTELQADQTSKSGAGQRTLQPSLREESREQINIVRVFVNTLQSS